MITFMIATVGCCLIYLFLLWQVLFNANSYLAIGAKKPFFIISMVFCLVFLYFAYCTELLNLSFNVTY